jgi:hypothetical protein
MVHVRATAQSSSRNQFISANLASGDAHNHRLQERYRSRVRPIEPWQSVSGVLRGPGLGRSPSRGCPSGHRESSVRVTAFGRRALRPGLPARQTHDYVRHGTTTLFAALEVATGRISADACYPRHTNQEFLAFLKQVAKAHPRVKLHVICDNYGTHSHDNVTAWLAKHPRITPHFTPTSCSWLNMVEIFFGIITRQAIRRGSFLSVDDLEDAIRAFIDAYNQRAKPFTWTKTADELITKITRK